MFTSISWNEYLSFTFTALFLYYTFIALRFYKWELLALAGIKRINTSSPAVSSAQFKDQFISANNHHPVQPETTNLISVKEELNALLINSSEIISTTELLEAINRILKKYPGELVKANRQELTEYIITESNRFFPALLQQHEVEQLWFG